MVQGTTLPPIEVSQLFQDADIVALVEVDLAPA
jgi:hypothetical protein